MSQQENIKDFNIQNSNQDTVRKLIPEEKAQTDKIKHQNIDLKSFDAKTQYIEKKYDLEANQEIKPKNSNIACNQHAHDSNKYDTTPI